MTSDALPAGAPTPTPTDEREWIGTLPIGNAIHTLLNAADWMQWESRGDAQVVSMSEVVRHVANNLSGLRSRQTRDEDGQRAETPSKFVQITATGGVVIALDEDGAVWQQGTVFDGTEHCPGWRLYPNVRVDETGNLLAPSTPQNEGSSQ